MGSIVAFLRSDGLVEHSIQRFSRKCFQSGREILPGEGYYSALYETPAGIERRDFAEDAWAGPPDDSFCFWKSRLPLPSQTQIRWADDSVLLAYLEQLIHSQRWEIANVLALALTRRRLLQLDYAEGEDESGERCNQLILTVRQNGETIRIPEVDLGGIDTLAIQQELDRNLFTDRDDDQRPSVTDPANKESGVEP